MIGLGSNRLSVCRRGGMRVTQAGRGGMEWLAGGRRPRWSSPYSAQATAALLAQFPTQWETIRDYGFAHPEIVPFINEDPMLVCSLVEVGKVRTATIRNKSASNHLYNGVILPTQWLNVGKMAMKISAPHNNTNLLSRVADLEAITTFTGYYRFGGTQSLGVGTITRLGTWTVDELVNVGLDFVTNTRAEYIRLGGINSTSYNYDLTIQQWDIYGTDDIERLYQLVPFLTNEGEVCFLDLVNLQLHHNVYTDPFTIQLTDKA